MRAKTIIHSILEENAVKAKKTIAEDLVLKMGQRLAEEYIRVAKETFNEDVGDGNLANNYPPFDKVTQGDVIAGARGEYADGEEDEEDEEGGEEVSPTQSPIKTPTGFDVRLSYGD